MLKIEITPQQPTTPPNPHQPTQPSPKGESREPSEAHRLPRVDARNHYPRIKHHTPPPKPGATTRLPPHTVARETRACCLKAQQCAWRPAPPKRGATRNLVRLCTRTRSTTDTPSDGRRVHPTNRLTTTDPTVCGAGQVSWCSLERR